jgi:glyoxylase-like metal-dependent hydrolase (beta-lactamase superfamily II)
VSFSRTAVEREPCERGARGEMGRAKATPSSAYDEFLLRKYGIHVVRCSLPIPATINVYFVKDPIPTIIDAPAKGTRYVEELDRALHARGSSVRGIRRIIITHPHFDHYGSAGEIIDRSGAELWVFREGAHWIERCGEELERQEGHRERLLTEAGAPPSDVEIVTGYYRKASRFAAEARVSRLLSAGDTFELGDAAFAVVPVPGHTPFCTLLFDSINRTAFTGDFLPLRMPGNPLVQWNDTCSPAYRATAAYVSSLEKARAMNLRLALPGHGPPITDPERTIDRLLASMAEERARVLRVLEEGGKTPYEIAREVFPTTPRESLFRTVSDVMGQLEILEYEGAIRRSGTTPVVFGLASRGR